MKNCLVVFFLVSDQLTLFCFIQTKNKAYMLRFVHSLKSPARFILGRTIDNNCLQKSHHPKPYIAKFDKQFSENVIYIIVIILVEIRAASPHLPPTTLWRSGKPTMRSLLLSPTTPDITSLISSMQLAM